MKRTLRLASKTMFSSFEVFSTLVILDAILAVTSFPNLFLIFPTFNLILSSEWAFIIGADFLDFFLIRD